MKQIKLSKSLKRKGNADELEEQCKALEAERDQWKKLAEIWKTAHERYHGVKSCGMCVHHQSASDICEACWDTADRVGWVLDEERFMEVVTNGTAH